MDVIDLKSLDWASLKILYDKNIALLHEKLLSGADWKETEYLRSLVTQLETAMDNTMPTQQWMSTRTENPDLKAHT
ncbi:MAG TPA: hypothetical protein VD794_12845 [Flavisolibacter sp.]|nr:hypothetical protein [Flavisolibacter sp.]